MDNLHSQGILFLVITGGEPFLRPDILEILNHARSLNFLSLSIYTNGYLIDDSRLAQLCGMAPNLRTIQMSVFSHIPEVHDSYMGLPGSLKRIMFSGRALMDSGIRVTLSLNVLEFNVDTTQESIDFFSSRGFKILVGCFKDIPNLEVRTHLIGSIEPDFFERFVTGLAPNLRRKYLRDMQNRCSDSGTGLCEGRFTQVMIDSAGYIHPCPSFPGITMGNIISTESLHSAILSSSEFKAARALTRDDIPACKSCDFKSFCSICIGKMHNEFGGYDKPCPQSCHYAQALRKAGKLSHAAA